MKLVRDTTGRFTKRPFFEPDELESVCTSALHAHCDKTGRRLEFPLSTDVLTTLIENHTASLDLYADLAAEGSDVEGVTDFYRGARPRVRISRSLSEDPLKEARLRTTLAHEFCHARIHDHLFQVPDHDFDFFRGSGTGVNRPVVRACGEGTIVSAPQVDWMEWQAGYVCGALLMPKVKVREIVKRRLTSAQAFRGVSTGSDEAETLALDLSNAFRVSRAAARVRLEVLGFTAKQGVQGNLF